MLKLPWTSASGPLRSLSGSCRLARQEDHEAFKAPACAVMAQKREMCRDGNPRKHIICISTIHIYIYTYIYKNHIYIYIYYNIIYIYTILNIFKTYNIYYRIYIYIYISAKNAVMAETERRDGERKMPRWHPPPRWRQKTMPRWQAQRSTVMVKESAGMALCAISAPKHRDGEAMRRDGKGLRVHAAPVRS